MAAMAVLGSVPEDIEREILLRLPVKSLLRFKSVCKNWYALIKSPTFIKDHLNRSNEKRPQILSCDFYEEDRSSAPITFISDENEETPDPDHLRKFIDITYVVGSVDGLFLFQKGSYGREVRLGLWNPATREVRPLPAISPELQPTHIQPDYGKDLQMLGFGLDTSTNDYKVVWIRFFVEVMGHTITNGTYAAVYSCSSDSSWRLLENPIDRTRFSDYSGIYRDGFYYWLFEGEHIYNIISFDFVNEVFEEIGGPVVPLSSRVDLSLFDDSVAIFARDEMIGANDLWVMIEPGVWNKLLTFPFLPINDSRYCYIWDSRTVIFENDDYDLMSYDLKTQVTRNLGFDNVGLRSFDCSFHYYKESLVPIKRENGESKDCCLADIFDSS